MSRNEQKAERLSSSAWVPAKESCHHPHLRPKSEVLEDEREKSPTVAVFTDSLEDTMSRDAYEPSPGLWDRINMLWRIVLRALGLPMIYHTFGFLRHPLGRGLHEPLKVAIHRDRPVAFLRALIHLLPVSMALCEIALNWNNYYVGAVSYDQATYQLLAKVHELLIQASVAAILFTSIRNELAFGEGLPFGLLLSGLQITQISYLWSIEFWGSLRIVLQRPPRRTILLLLVPLCVLLATLCGPSSAVLLVPRSQFWPGGSADIWINATYDELWPTTTDIRSVPDGCLEIPPDQLNGDCPSSEWQRIRDYMALSKEITPSMYKDQYDDAQAPKEIGLTDRASIRQLSIVEDEAYIGSGPRPIVAMTQHAALADALTTTGALWFLSLTNVTAQSGHGSPLSDQSDAIHSISEGYKQPYSTVVCVPDSATSPHDETPLGIPNLPNANAASLANGNITYDGCSPGTQITAETIAHPSMTRGQMFNLSGSSTQYSLHWIELEPDLFLGSSIAAIVVLPRATANDTQETLICNLSAGWGSAAISMHTIAGGTSAVSSVVTNGDNHTTHPAPIQLTNIPPNQGINDNGNTYYFDYHLPNYPQQVINISQDWAQTLNPSIAGLNTTVINTLLQERIFDCSPRVSAEQALAALVVNGLAKTSAGSQLQGTVRTVGPNGDQGLDGNYWLSGKGDVFNVDESQSQNWVRFRVNSALQGYAYNTSGLAPRVAIAILTIYCILAFGHVFYAGWSGISSNSWDSIAEVTALAMNSSPTTALRNTCAGISELHIFKLPVRVLVRNDIQGEGEHLELAFGDVEEARNDQNSLKTNRAYGTMPIAKVTD